MADIQSQTGREGITVLKRNERLINTKITQYLLPGIMMTFALQLGNIVDLALAGSILGTDALAALSLAMPVEYAVQLPGKVLGVGGSIAAGIKLGKRDTEGASRLFTAVFAAVMVLGAICTIAGPFICYPIGEMLAGGKGLGKLTGDYLLAAITGAPILSMSLMMIYYLGVDSHPELCSVFLIAANVINLVLDYFLLSYTSLGTLGASLSTMLGYLLGMVVLVFYCRSPKRMIHFKWPKSFKILKEALVAGVPALVFMVVSVARIFSLNTIVLNALGNDGIAIRAICEQATALVAMLTGGILGVIPNIAGILYGEKDYYGLRVLCSRILRYSMIAAAVGMLVVLLFPLQVAGLFGVSDGPLMADTCRVLCICVISVPFYVWNCYLARYYESIEQTDMANLASFGQAGLFLIPAMFACISIEMARGGSGFNALAVSQIIAEITAALVALAWLKIRHRGKGLLLLPHKDEQPGFDFTIRADIKEVRPLAKGVADYLCQNGISPKKANLAAVAAEEMASNVIRYGGDKSQWIDVCVVVEGDAIRLRIRDNGKPFNPVEYEFDREDFYSIHGIEIVKSLCTSINYMRAADMNNTVLEFS